MNECLFFFKKKEREYDKRQLKDVELLIYKNIELYCNYMYWDKFSSNVWCIFFMFQ